jgi:hypothetical protein
LQASPSVATNSSLLVENSYENHGVEEQRIAGTYYQGQEVGFSWKTDLGYSNHAAYNKHIRHGIPYGSHVIFYCLLGISNYPYDPGGRFPVGLCN